jgi:hypothetical protein
MDEGKLARRLWVLVARRQEPNAVREHGHFTDNLAKSLQYSSCNGVLGQISPIESSRSLVGAVGIEPTTFGLKGRCSTTELRP